MELVSECNVTNVTIISAMSLWLAIMMPPSLADAPLVEP